VTPESYFVSGSSIQPFKGESWESIERDPRGLLLVWSQPKPRATYIAAMDPTQGITGWSRGTRTEGDHKTDNGVIEIFEVDGEKVQEEEVDAEGQPVIDRLTKKPKLITRYRDVQVAEFAAPCDAVEIARVADILGRIYKGVDEDACELIWESWPGCGMLTTQELLRLSYPNLWHWEHISDEAETTSALGWRSTRESMKLLWYRARRHLMQRNAIIRSQFLLDEYSNAEIDLEKMRARAAYGSHDDRFMAANLAFWAGHKWTYDVERSSEIVTTAPVLDYQRFAPTFEDEGLLTFEDWRSARVAEMERD